MLETQRVNLHLDKKFVKEVERMAKQESKGGDRRVYPVEIYRRLLRIGLEAEKGGKK